MERLSEWLGSTALNEAALNQSAWLVPLIQTLHILAITVVVGSSLVIALRLAGAAGTDWTPARWSRRLSPWLTGALAILLLSGLILIVTEPERALLNTTFQTKMALVLLAAVLSWVLARRMASLERKPPLTTDRALAILLFALWLAIIAAGRWIGYT